MSNQTKQQLLDRNAELLRQCDKLHSKAVLFDSLRKLMGYVENGTETTVTLSQDDATKDFFVTVGKKTYYSRSLVGAIEDAIKDNPEE